MPETDKVVPIPPGYTPLEPTDFYQPPQDDEVGDLHGRYTAPSAEKDGWDTHGLVSLNVAILAVNIQLLRGSVKNTAAIHRRKVTAMREALVKFGVIQALKKGASKTERALPIPGGAFKVLPTALATALKSVLQWAVLVFQVWEVQKGQREIEESIRRAAIQTQRSLLTGKMNRDHNVNSRLMRVVSTRLYDSK
jgi:hypothetical protein